MATNNKFNDCPPLMSDGRLFTDYRLSADVNNIIRKNANASVYKQYLTTNGNKLIKKNRELAKKRSHCNQPKNNKTLLSERNILLCGPLHCSVSELNNNGLGLGRKNTYLESCCAENNNLYNYYADIDTVIQGSSIHNVTIKEPKPSNL